MARDEGPGAVLVAGAGYLGSAVARRLGPRTVVTRRRPTDDPRRPLPDGVEVVGLDLLAEPIRDVSVRLTRLADGRAVLACLAPGRAGRPDTYPALAARLADALPGSVQRVVWVSSTSACADVDGPVTCATPGPVGPRGLAQREAEDAIRRRCDVRGIPWAILRLGGLYGPGRPIAGRFLDGPAPPTIPGHGWTATNLIHLADATALAVAALAAPDACGRILAAVAPDPTPRRVLYARAAAARGRPAPRFAEPIPKDRRIRGKRVDGSATAQRLGR